MLDVSLIDVREFIKNALAIGIDYRQLSVSAVRTRLFFLTRQNKLNTLSEFTSLFFTNEEFRARNCCFIEKPREIFREAEKWIQLFNSINNDSIDALKILLIDTTQLGDLITMQLCMEILGIMRPIEITLVQIGHFDLLKDSILITDKEIETLKANLFLSKANPLVSNYLDNGMMSSTFTLRKEWVIQNSFSTGLPSEVEGGEYDWIIMNNLSLVLAHNVIENLFKQLETKLKRGGLFVTGSKEDFTVTFFCRSLMLKAQVNAFVKI